MTVPGSTVTLSDQRDRPDSIHALIYGRMAFIFVLLLASWWWTGSYVQPPSGIFPTGLFSFFLVSIGLTIAYHLASYFVPNRAVQRRVQFYVDVLLVSWLVIETGDINSPYVSLYIVIICVAGFLLDRS